jgi:FAD:protein FMN transferase
MPTTARGQSVQSVQSVQSAPEVYTFEREHVLGTSLQWNVGAPHPALAEQTEVWVLNEIERLRRIFSRYDDQSELCRLPVTAGSAAAISSELAQVLQAAEEYRLDSKGSFDVRASWLVDRESNYRKSEHRESEHRERSHAKDKLPLQHLANSFRESPPYRLEWDADHRCSVELLQDCPKVWTLDGIAKGFILDRVVQGVMKFFPEVSGGCLNIGGDLVTFGDFSCRVSIDDPHCSAENASPLLEWRQRTSMAVATSGSYRRFSSRGTERVSHLIDPRSGRPADGPVSVTVVAPSAMEADAMATAISVMGVEEGLRWMESKDSRCCACLLVDAEGQIYTSSAWAELTGVSSQREGTGSSARTSLISRHAENLISRNAEKSLPSGLHVWFELTRPSTGSYRRPYVAIWLEDDEGFPVRTAVLWLQTDQPGPRWHRDLTRWYRNDRVRKLVEKKDLIETSSGATRGPGKYEAHFDGTDNLGEPLKPGRYVLLIEAAREHGTYQLIRQPFDWGDRAIEKTELEGNEEISQAAFQFEPFSPSGPN